MIYGCFNHLEIISTTSSSSFPKIFGTWCRVDRYLIYWLAWEPKVPNILYIYIYRELEDDGKTTLGGIPGKTHRIPVCYISLYPGSPSGPLKK